MARENHNQGNKCSQPASLEITNEGGGTTPLRTLNHCRQPHFQANQQRSFWLRRDLGLQKSPNYSHKSRDSNFPDDAYTMASYRAPRGDRYRQESSRPQHTLPLNPSFQPVQAPNFQPLFQPNRGLESNVSAVLPVAVSRSQDQFHHCAFPTSFARGLYPSPRVQEGYSHPAKGPEMNPHVYVFVLLLSNFPPVTYF